MRTNTKPRVFVLMPFSKKYNDLYKLGIKAACSKAGAACERVDEQMFHGRITDRVCEQIATADVLVAETSSHNPNVFYEVGYAHALGKHVILLADDSEKIPFDVKDQQHLIYGGSIDGLRSELTNRVKWALCSPPSPSLSAKLPIKANGFTFFPNRDSMHQNRNLASLLADASRVKMILVGGSKLVEDQVNLVNVKQAMLPHPGSQSLSLYAHSVNDFASNNKSGLRGKILTTSHLVIDAGVNVRWYPEFIHHATIVADAKSDTGWAQWESVLPFAPISERSCVVVQNRTHRSLVRSVDRVFDLMFKKASAVKMRRGKLVSC